MSNDDGECGTNLWHQVIVEDAYNLSGISAEDFLGPLIRGAKIRWVSIRDLVGAYSGLQGHEGEVLAAPEFLKKLSEATQYDWALFYLYLQEPSLSDIKMDERLNIMLADITVRLVDDQYFYVYTKKKRFIDYILVTSTSYEHKICSFENLDIPY